MPTTGKGPPKLESRLAPFPAERRLVRQGVGFRFICRYHSVVARACALTTGLLNRPETASSPGRRYCSRVRLRTDLASVFWSKPAC